MRKILCFVLFFHFLPASSQTNFPTTWKSHAGNDLSWASENFSDESWEAIVSDSGMKKENSWFRLWIPVTKPAGSQSGVLVLSIKNAGPGQQLYWNGQLVNSREAAVPAQLSAPVLHYYIHDKGGDRIHWKKNNLVALHIQKTDAGARAEDSSDYSFRYIPAESAWGYSFNFPHRMTVGLPVNSNRTLLDVYENYMKLSWTYGNLNYFPFASFRPLIADWSGTLTPLIDGKTTEHTTEARAEGVLPVLQTSYSKNGVTMKLETAGADTATLIQIQLENKSSITHDVVLRYRGQTYGCNPGWLDSADGFDRLLAGWGAPADQILVMGIGADTYTNNGSQGVTMSWTLPPGQTKTAWLIRPYNSFDKDAPSLRAVNWENEFQKGKQVWRDLLARAMRIHIPDPFVSNGYYASLADCFIMREPIGKGYISSVMGTEGYRSGPSCAEPMLVAVALDQNGMHRDAEQGVRVDMDWQEADGNWTEPGGWTHKFWGGAGFKSWAFMEHFYLTQDTNYLRELYPKMKASTFWQEKQRAKTRFYKAGMDSLDFGLMPKGVGDCGLMNDEDFYGIYLPHNFWSVFADSLTLSAAIILKQMQDTASLRAIYEHAKKNLLYTTRQGAIRTADGSSWIPGVARKQSGSRWGALNSLYPTGLLEPQDPLVNGTMKFMDKNSSPGGLQMNTGWLKNGMWVAISLDNVAEVHLVRNEGDAASRLLTATLNHGTPLYTWCEERGPESYTDTTTGDRQHLWTPVALVRYVRDALIMEGTHELFLAKGVDRNWIASGKEIGVEHAPTHFGTFSYSFKYNQQTSTSDGTVTFPPENVTPVTLYTRLPKGAHIISVDKKSGARVLGDGSGLIWDHGQGTKTFTVQVSSK